MMTLRQKLLITIPISCWIGFLNGMLGFSVQVSILSGATVAGIVLVTAWIG